MKTHIILMFTVFISVLMLQNCSSLLTISATSVITNALNDSRTIGTQLDDNILKIWITHALLADKNIRKKTRIVSTIYQGNILLTGQSLSPSLTGKIIRKITKIQGVKNIYNEIRHNQPISSKRILTDFWITTQIKLNFLLQKKIHCFDIKIITENSEVFLFGKIQKEEKLLAKNIAQSIPGVKNVFTIYSFTNYN